MSSLFQQDSNPQCAAFNQAGWFRIKCYPGKFDGNAGEPFRDSGFSCRGPIPKYTVVCKSAVTLTSNQVAFKKPNCRMCGSVHSDSVGFGEKELLVLW